jgi:hypothetical protein
MAHALTDPLPRLFQANVHRFYERVVVPGLANPTRHVLEIGGVEHPFAFLDGPAAQVDRHTANEAAKAFTLILASLFERHLRIWARGFFADDRKPDVAGQEFTTLLRESSALAGVDLAYRRVQFDLEEAQLVANVVRHGDGQSCDRLQDLAPDLWKYEATEYFDLLPGSPTMSERMRVDPGDVTSYARAALRFWGMADRLPLAIIEPPI